MKNNLEFWKKFIKLQVTHNIDYLVENSIKDFHFKGLNYICLQFSSTLTIRLYILEPSEPVDTKNVNIHNHLYDSQMLCLVGTLINNVYRTTSNKRGITGYNHYFLTSALAPDNKEKKIKLENLGKTSLKLWDRQVLTPGETHFQDSEEIHNVENIPNDFTAWMIFEFPTVKERSILFSKKYYGDTIPTPGMYTRYKEEEIQNLVYQVLDKM